MKVYVEFREIEKFVGNFFVDCVVVLEVGIVMFVNLCGMLVEESDGWLL